MSGNKMRDSSRLTIGLARRRGISQALRHARALAAGQMLIRRFRQMFNHDAMSIQPRDVIRILKDAGIKFTLVGAHAIGGWLDEQRFSRGIDSLIHNQHRRAVQSIRKAYPDLIVLSLSAVTRFLDPSDREPVIDLIKPQAAIYKAVPKHSVPVGKSHRIPNLEMALALKYAAIISPTRTLKKRYLDRADFLGMVEKNYEQIDMSKLSTLGELIKTGGGRQIRRMVEEARAQEESEPEG